MAEQTQLWAGRYERELVGILALQNDVAHKVAGALALTRLSAEQAPLAGARPVDPEVHERLLKGGCRCGPGRHGRGGAKRPARGSERPGVRRGLHEIGGSVAHPTAIPPGARSRGWSEKACAERDPNTPFIGCNPIFDPLRTEPRFQALLKAMGLPQ